jgi:hypothetical protein
MSFGLTYSKNFPDRQKVFKKKRKFSRHKHIKFKGINAYKSREKRKKNKTKF